MENKLVLTGRVSIMEFELLLFLLDKPKTCEQICEFLQNATPSAAWTCLCRLKKRKLVSSARRGFYQASAEASDLLGRVLKNN